MHKEKHYAAKSIQILPGNPTATAIHQILTWALENLDKQVEVIWPSATKGSEYKLTAHADPMGGDPQWKLIASNAGQGSLFGNLLVAIRCLSSIASKPHLMIAKAINIRPPRLSPKKNRLKRKLSSIFQKL
jgi:hypothetical protein